MKRTTTAALFALALLLGACSSDDSGNQRADLIETLQQPDTAGLDEATAECVADEIIGTLSEEQVQTFIDGNPAGIDAYTAARQACDDIPGT